MRKLRYELENELNKFSQVAEVGGVPVAVTTERMALDDIRRRALDKSSGGYSFRFVNAYSIALAARDRVYGELLEAGGTNFPDGKPVSWVLRLVSRSNGASQVRGPSVFRRAMIGTEFEGVRHFLLGGSPETQAALRRVLNDRSPETIIAGSFCPPMSDSNDVKEMVEQIRNAEPDIVWVALGTPKQDFIAQEIADSLNVTTAAIGAALDFVAETKRESPRVMSDLGIEWLFRLATEPRRLWKRYLFGNVVFLWSVVKAGVRDTFRPDAPASRLADETTTMVFVDQNDPSDLGTGGGIATCIRGQIKVGVCSETRVACLSNGKTIANKWVERTIDGNRIEIFYLGRTVRRIPDSAILTLGLLRHRREFVGALSQVHRVEIGLVASLLRLPYVLLIHNDAASLSGANSDSIWRHLPRVYRCVEKWSVRHATAVGVFSRQASIRLQSIRPEVKRLRTWYDPTLFYLKSPANQSSRVEDDALNIIWVGRLDRQKDPLLALDAVTILAETTSLHLDVFGDGPLRQEMAQRITTDGLPVTLHGTVSPVKIADAMRNANVCLMTSFYEGSPTVLIESLACGTPVVATSESDTDYVLEDIAAGVRVAERDPRKLAEAVLAADELDPKGCAAAVRSRSAEVQLGELQALTSTTNR